MPINWNGPQILDRARAELMQTVVRCTETVRNEAISLILNTPKTGRVYRHRSVLHQSSAPGEAPASDTGRLVNSIKTEYDLPNLTGKVVASVEYGDYLEYGTQKLEPRPFLRPALANREQWIKDEIAATLRRVLGTP